MNAIRQTLIHGLNQNATAEQIGNWWQGLHEQERMGSGIDELVRNATSNGAETLMNLLKTQAGNWVDLDQPWEMGTDETTRAGLMGALFHGAGKPPQGKWKKHQRFRMPGTFGEPPDAQAEPDFSTDRDPRPPPLLLPRPPPLSAPYHGCPYCAYSAKHSGSLYKHLRQHHPGAPKRAEPRPPPLTDPPYLPFGHPSARARAPEREEGSGMPRGGTSRINKFRVSSFNVPGWRPALRMVKGFRIIDWMRNKNAKKVMAETQGMSEAQAMSVWDDALDDVMRSRPAQFKQELVQHHRRSSEFPLHPALKAAALAEFAGDIANAKNPYPARPNLRSPNTGATVRGDPRYVAGRPVVVPGSDIFSARPSLDLYDADDADGAGRMRKPITMPLGAFKREHKKLVKVLERGTAAQRRKEAQEQRAELKARGGSAPWRYAHKAPAFFDVT